MADYLAQLSELNYIPGAVAIVFYVAVFGLGEIGRRITARLFSQNTTPYVFFIELIGTTQMCACVYENGIMIVNYGIIGFFFTVTTLLYFGSVFNKGAFVSPLGPVEAFYNNTIGLGRFLTLLSAELLGATLGSQLAFNIWFQTYSYTDAHLHSILGVQSCAFNYKVAFPLVVAFEVLGCALIRIVAVSLSERHKWIVMPAFVSFMLSIALYVIGVAGLNPIVASSRMFNCQGLDHQWFLAVYWICPVLGWLLGAKVVSKMAVKAPKKIKKKAN